MRKILEGRERRNRASACGRAQHFFVQVPPPPQICNRKRMHEWRAASCPCDRARWPQDVFLGWWILLVRLLHQTHFSPLTLSTNCYFHTASKYLTLDHFFSLMEVKYRPQKIVLGGELCLRTRSTFFHVKLPRRKANIIKYSSQTNIFSLSHSAHELFHSLPWRRQYVDIKMQLDGRFLKAPSNLSANSQSAFLIRLPSRSLDFLFDSSHQGARESKSDVLKGPIREIVCLFVLRGVHQQRG